MRLHLVALGAAFTIVGLLGVNTAFAGGAEVRLETGLVAVAAAGDVSGAADFRNRLDRGRRQFSVEVEGFTPGMQFDVTVAGVLVGTVEIDGFGTGGLDFDDTAQPDDFDAPFPAGFPSLDGGEQVVVGPLSGTLQSK